MTEDTWDRADAARLAGSALPASERSPRVEMVVRGRVRRGVEAHSVVLHCADGRQFQLGGGHSRYTGHMVLVQGVVREDLLTTTQEGVVLRVESIQILDDDLTTGGSTTAG